MSSSFYKKINNFPSLTLIRFCLLFFCSLCLQALFHPHQFYLRFQRLLNISTLLSTLCQLEIPSQFLTFPFYAKSFLTLCFTCHQTNGCQTVLAITRFSPSLPSQAVFSSHCSLHQPTPLITSFHPPTPAFSLFSSPSL